MPDVFPDKTAEEFPNKAIYAPEAEQAVLGAVLRDPSVLPKVIRRYSRCW